MCRITYTLVYFLINNRCEYLFMSLDIYNFEFIFVSLISASWVREVIVSIKILSQNVRLFGLK